MTSLSHRNIINCNAVITKPAECWLVMEYANLGNLQSLVKVYGPLEEKTIAIYTRQMLSGLAYLHENRIVHRDIKPSNILLTNEVEIKLSDFGCSFKMIDSQTKEDMVDSFKGSIPYMAPEVLLQANLPRRSDIWSLGCTVLEMATAKPPWSEKNFDNNFAAILTIGKNDITPEVPESLSPDLKDFIGRCLKREPKERPSAEELLGHALITKYGSPQSQPVT